MFLRPQSHFIKVFFEARILKPVGIAVDCKPDREEDECSKCKPRGKTLAGRNLPVCREDERRGKRNQNEPKNTQWLEIAQDEIRLHEKEYIVNYQKYTKNHEGPKRPKERSLL